MYVQPILLLHRPYAAICIVYCSVAQDRIVDLFTVTPGITAQEYAHRRSRLANRLPKNAIAIVAAADIKYRAAGVFYEYRQDSNFFYLTGML